MSAAKHFGLALIVALGLILVLFGNGVSLAFAADSTHKSSTSLQVAKLVPADSAPPARAGADDVSGNAKPDIKQVAKPTWSGATNMPVNSRAFYTVKDGTVRVVSGAANVSVSNNVVTAKKAGFAQLGLYDKAGNLRAKKTVYVYPLNGSYTLQSSMNKKLVLDIDGVSKNAGARMIVWYRNNGLNQKFRFVAQTDGTYAIKCAHSNKYVDVDGASTQSGRQVIQWYWNGGDNQRWRILVDASNRLTFVSKKSGKCFDVNGGVAKAGRNTIQWPSNNGLNQKWTIADLSIPAYKPASYKVTYKLGGGANNAANPASYKEGSNAITLKAPTRTGYTFKGWYADAKFTKKVSAIAANSTGNKTFYAKWTADTYKVSYMLDGGKNNAANPASYAYGTSVALKNPTRAGYTFKGWYEDASLTKKISSISKSSIGNKALYAKWGADPISTGLSGRAKLAEHIQTFAYRYRNCPKGGIALVGSSTFARWTAATEFKAAGWDGDMVYNCSVAGGRIADFESSQAYIDLVASLEPSLIVIYGSNDLSVTLSDPSQDFSTPEKLADTTASLISKLTAACGHDTQFIVVSSTKTPDGYASCEKKGRADGRTCASWERIDYYSELLEAYAASHRNVTYYAVGDYVHYWGTDDQLHFYINGDKLKDASQTATVSELRAGTKTNPYFGDDNAHMTPLAYHSIWGEFAKFAVSMAS